MTMDVVEDTYQTDKDVHAEDIPGDEQCSCVCSTAAVAFQETPPFGAEWFRELKVTHDSIPALPATHSKEQNQSLWNRPEIYVSIAIGTNFRKA